MESDFMAHKRSRNIESLPEVKELLREALAEDIGKGDATSRALIGPKETARAVIVAKGRYILAGGQIARRVFALCDPSLSVRLLVKDGSRVSAGDPILHVKGKARGILAAERVALNFLQRMTGIATLTRQFVQKAKPYGVQVLDTRKTTPLMRTLEKYAVLCGGGVNHRMGLYDRVLIKDNHRAFWRRSKRGNLAEAVVAARRRNPGLPVEVEVESENDLKTVLKASPNWVLLDNMPVGRIRRCVQICAGKSKIEVSGGVSLKTIERIAQTGVDAVSVGALTHSAPAADLSLEFCD
jgi:nicotinate-nucleotide pyrophosphorylase (carboxylating)